MTSHDLYGVQILRDGNAIKVTGLLSYFDGVPHQASSLPIDIGALPTGSYTINLQLFDDGTTCAPLNGAFVVGGVAAAEAPTLSRPMSVLLLLLSAVVASTLHNREKRSSARH